ALLSAARIPVVVAPATGSPLATEALRRGWPILKQDEELHRERGRHGSAGEPGTPQGAETVRILPRSQPPALPVTLFGLAAFAGEGGGDGLGFILAGGFDAGDLQRGRGEAEAAGGVDRGGG